ncbi:MAG: type II toxin-antitoxin system RelE/ParE family toxin [Candidatus Kapabacteria bacterium]|jgi:plasmid stabilization system protein ParE|nr:type II toxin-antitoxin system RelE/ParE family toxin [Candidatus Kapabacteria bacterium]
MKNGYKIHWTDNALNELQKTITYLEENFSDKEIKKLSAKIENTVELISINPNIFQLSDIKGVFKVVVLKYNTLYYRIRGNRVEILSFFSNRQSPKRLRI